MRKVRELILSQLRQGQSADKIALGLAAGIVLSSFPIIGTTTVLCLIAGVSLRLNHVVLQTVNQLSYPIQLGLLVPFVRLGERLFSAPPVSLDPRAVWELYRADFFGATAFYGATMARSAAAWLLVAPPAGWLLYRAILPLVEAVWRREARPPAEGVDGQATGAISRG